MRILYIHSDSPLEALAESSFTLTPKIALCSPGLYLEIQGTQKALGGEPRLLQQAESLLETFLGSQYQMVVCDRPEWARAFLADEPQWIPPGKSHALLKKLPIEQLLWVGDPLRQHDEQKEKERLIFFLKKVGFRTIGDFLSLPPEAIHHRFGKQGKWLWDWAAGEQSLCLPPFSASPTLQESIDADDLVNLDALLFRLRQVLIRIQTRLQGRAQAAKKFRLVFHFESHPSTIRFLQLTEPQQEAQALLRLFRDFLSGLHWESPLVRLELEIQDLVSHAPGQLSLWDDSESRFQNLAHYVSRLRARLGENNAGFAHLKSSHFPERSFTLAWPPVADPLRETLFPRRPVFLFTPPKPFQPSPLWELLFLETLFVEWWESDHHRQYFFAQHKHTQEKLWVFQDKENGKWFTHGAFE